MLNRFITIIFFSILAANFSLGQSSSDPKPLPPTVQVLTLDPATGIPTITWTPPSFNPLHPNPQGFIIYVPREGNIYYPGEGWQEIDTVSASTFTYTHLSGSGLNSRTDYTVASLGPNEPSQIAAHHGSIHLTVAYDSCGNKLNVAWGHYFGWGNRIENYKIYMGETPNWNTFNHIGTVAGNQTIYFHPIDADREYYLYVEAKKLDSELRTRSNRVFVSTKVSKRPAFMFIDSILAGDRQIDLHFRIDNSTEYRRFAVVRWEQPDSMASIFSAKRLFEFSEPTTIFYSDTTDSWAARSRPFYYKINAYDGCNRLKAITNLTNSVTIKGFTRGLNANITWDKLYSAKGNTITYKLYRSYSNPNPSTPVLIHEVVNPTETVFLDNLSQFEGLGYLPKFCYYVEAYEHLDGPEVYRISRSRNLCIEVTPNIIIPNALDPLSRIMRAGVARNVFAPTITFDSSYKLIIYNRWGGIVYEGLDTGWNGRLPNGELAKEGSYIYRLEVFIEGGRMISKTGSLTVIYGPQ